jgi:dihydropteroate synthase
VQAQRAGVLRLGQRAFGPGELLVMAVANPAGGLAKVRTAVAEGADIVTVAASGAAEGTGEAATVAALVTSVRDAFPELIIGVSTGRREVARAARAAGADLLGARVLGAGVLGARVLGARVLGAGVLGACGDQDFAVAGVAAESGAAVACPADLAARVVAAGVEPDRVIACAASTRTLTDDVASGWPVLVSLPDQDPAGSLATAAVAAWLGARVFRANRVGETRRALRMVSAIRGDVPPACAVRGLA